MMKRLAYAVTALDLDGTLTNEAKEITPWTKDVLIQYQQAGGRIVLASGRPTYGVMPLAEELELEKYGGYVLAFNGAVLYDCKAQKMIFRQTYGRELVEEIVKLSKLYGTEMLAYTEDTLLTESPENEFVQIEHYVTKMKIEKTDNIVEAIHYPVEKVMMIKEGELLAEIEPKVKEVMGDRLSIYRSAPFYLEIMSKGIDKAQTLARLLQHLHLQREDLAAFGDGFNDVAMIKYAGLGVAMGNAEDTIKEIADRMTCTNEEDGVAEVVKEFFSYRP